MTDLESISFDEVWNTKHISYADWRKRLKPIYAVVWRDIILGYAAVITIFVLSAGFEHYFPSWTIPNVIVSSLVLGVTLAYLSLFIHEAGHFNIHPDKKTNDLLSNIFLCLPFALDIGTYRKIHWQHHLHLGTPSDTETSYFNALTPALVIESFTGIHLLKVIRKKSRFTVNEKMRKRSLSMLILGGMLNIGIVGVFVAFGYWYLAVEWLTGMIVFFPFFAGLRQILEHRSELAEKNVDYTQVQHGKITRLFTSRFFSRVFGGAGFNKHMIHHWDPQMSYTRLKDVEAFLMESDVTRNLISTSRTTYIKTLKKLVSR